MCKQKCLKLSFHEKDHITWVILFNMKCRKSKDVQVTPAVNTKHEITSTKHGTFNMKCKKLKDVQVVPALNTKHEHNPNKVTAAEGERFSRHEQTQKLLSFFCSDDHFGSFCMERAQSIQHTVPFG